MNWMDKRYREDKIKWLFTKKSLFFWFLYLQHRPLNLIFPTMNSQSLKYKWFTPSGCKDRILTQIMGTEK